MVASTGIYEITGPAAIPVFTQLTSSRYSLSDNVTPGIANPIIIPSNGVNYSYWKHQVLNFTGTFTTIDNIRWYTDGSVGWNVGASGKLMVAMMSGGAVGAPVAQYVNASGNATTGVWVLSGHTYYANTSGKIGNAGSFTISFPLLVDSTQYLASGYSKVLVTQVAVATDATQGTQTPETVTFQYDES